MTTSIETVQSIVNSAKTTDASERTELGQDDFLKLMTTQLSNQDPFQPMENGEFIAEMAQFGTVSGIQELQETVANLAETMAGNQLMQVAPLVGKDVVVEAAAGYFDGESMKGSVNVDCYASEVSLQIYSPSGVLVDQISMGAQSPGDVQFEWDGKNSLGEYVSEGGYRVTASALSDGNVVALTTLMNAKVESVSIGSGGSSTTLNLKGIGEVNLNSVSKVM